MSLSGFKGIEWPDVMPVKLVYNDVRAITAAGNEGEYVYRMNSVFDPDFAAGGGQPEGFDQLAVLYGRYRVVALLVDLLATSLTSGNAGCIAIAPSSNSALSTTAEQLAGMRYAHSAEYAFGGAIAKIRALFHIGELLGYSDMSLLANSNLDAAVTGNPGFQQYLYVQNRDSSATGAIQLTIKLTYFVRMEVPTTAVDSIAKVKFAQLRVRTASIPSSPPLSGATCGSAKSNDDPVSIVTTVTTRR